MNILRTVIMCLNLLPVLQLQGQDWKGYLDSAKFYDGRQNAVKAIENYEKTILLWKKDSMWSSSNGQINNRVGVLYFFLKQYENSEIYLREGMRIREKVYGKEHRDYAASCYNLGILYKAILRYGEALNLFLESKDIRERQVGKESAEYDAACNMLANTYFETGEFSRAEPLYRECITIREKLKGKNSIDYARAIGNLAYLFWKKSEYENAVPLAIESREIIKNIAGLNSADYASSCNILAGIYMDKGEFYKSEELYFEQKSIVEKLLGRETEQFAAACNDLATLYVHTGRYHESELFYRQAKEIRGQIWGNDHPMYAGVCGNMGNLYFRMAKYEEAEAAYLEAKSIIINKLGTGSPQLTGILTGIANLYFTIGDYTKSETLYRQALSIIETLFGQNQEDYIGVEENIAIQYRARQQYDKAQDLLISLKEKAEKILGKQHPGYLKILQNLALLYQDKGLYDKAVIFYKEVLTAQENLYGKEMPDYQTTANNLGIAYIQMGQYENAKKILLEAKEIKGKILGKEHDEYMEICVAIGNLYRLLKEYNQADISYQEAIHAQETYLKEMFQFTNEQEQQYLLKRIFANQSEILSFYEQDYSHPNQGFCYNLSLGSRNLILSAALTIRNAVISSGDNASKAKYDHLISLKEQIAYWYTKPASERPGSLREVEEKAQIIEKELARSFSGLEIRQKINDVNWNQVQEKLLLHEAAIEFLEIKEFDGQTITDKINYVALILKKDKTSPEMIKLFEKRQLDSLIINKGTSPGEAQLTLMYSDRIKGVVPGATKTLYDLIWKPLESKLDGIKRVYFAPAGSLHKISFAALPINDKEVLCDRYQLVQLNTTASVVDQLITRVSKADNISLYGGVDYNVDSTKMRKAAAVSLKSNEIASRAVPKDLERKAGQEFKYLPGTQKEITNITRMAGEYKFTATSSAGVLATEESLKALNGKNSPTILHIATHGFFFPDPKNEVKDGLAAGGMVFKQSDNPLLRSGLALSGANNFWKGKPVSGVEDGILTAYEVSNMYLPNTKLAVLSACETGLGDIQGSEGVYGLQRAFKIAGVQNLIMSLWEVPDEATAEFMTLFYRKIFSGENIQAAFYNTQEKMKNKYRKSPHKWAAWVLVR